MDSGASTKRSKTGWAARASRALALHHRRAHRQLSGRLRAWPIEEQPVHAQNSGRLRELLEVNGLDNVAVDAEAVALNQIALLPRRGQHYHRHRLRAGIAFDSLQHLEAVDQRKLDIQQDNLGAVADLPVGIAPGAEDEF